MAVRLAKPTEAEIVAFLEKAIPENKKRATTSVNMELKFITISLQNKEIFQV